MRPAKLILLVVSLLLVITGCSFIAIIGSGRITQAEDVNGSNRLTEIKLSPK